MSAKQVKRRQIRALVLLVLVFITISVHHAETRREINHTKNRIALLQHQVHTLTNQVAELRNQLRTQTSYASSLRYCPNELDILARLVSAEAKGESLRGQMAVANVVLNRVADSRFPSTIKDVIYQQGQFCVVRSKAIYMEPTAQSIEAAKRVLLGERVLPSYVVFFHNPQRTSRGNWIRSRKPVITIGRHVFAK